MTTEHEGEPTAHHPNPHQLSDPELIAAVRGGDVDAFGPLYTRHVEAARRLARGLARDQAEADDLVAEAFAKLLTALRGGGGPNLAFRAYLLTTIRNLLHDRRKLDGRVKVTDDLTGHDAGVPFEDTAVADLESVAVFDELTPLRGEQSFSAAAYGHPGRATIGFVGWEGDRGLDADQLRLGGTPLGGGDNLAAGRADGTPAGWNTLGTDARTIAAPFPSGGNRPMLTAATGRDTWLLGPVVVVTPAPVGWSR
jgi:RNA polymerase sigma factor (sigma-70 family)